MIKKSKTIAKIIISGYYGFNNTGDEAILKSMVKAFKEKMPQIKIVVLSLFLFSPLSFILQIRMSSFLDQWG